MNQLDFLFRVVLLLCVLVSNWKFICKCNFRDFLFLGSVLFFSFGVLFCLCIN